MFESWKTINHIKRMHARKKKQFYCLKMTKILYFYHIWSLEMNLKKTKVKISTICGLEYLLHK